MAKETLHLTRYRTPPACEIAVPPPATRYQVVRDLEVNGRRRVVALTYPFTDRGDAELALTQIARECPAHVQEVTS
jgi:hypothetical protein